jgi:Peptidase family M50
MDRPRIVNQYEVPQRDYEPVQPRSGLRDLLKKLAAPLVAVGALLLKFGAVLFKAKFLFSIFVSAAVYVWIGGWWFGIGLVVLLFVHEMGHVLEAKRQGLPVSAPFFIPFLGAAIQMKRMPQSAWHEALNGIAGPILGSLGAAVVWGIGAYYDSRPLIALAFLGFLINLFNLVPVPPARRGTHRGGDPPVDRRARPRRAGRPRDHPAEPDPDPDPDPDPRRNGDLATAGGFNIDRTSSARTTTSTSSTRSRTSTRAKSAS